MVTAPIKGKFQESPEVELILPSPFSGGRRPALRFLLPELAHLEQENAGVGTPERIAAAGAALG
jgi:hypothetical protein